jgi:predicted lipoprotein with Yx(FWY)xxD motif
LAGCGSAANNNSAAAPAANSPTVDVRTIVGLGSTLVTANGKTLYFADQDSAGQIHCLQACLHFWAPLTVASGAVPTGQSGLATTTRPDGLVQVVYQGKPLYTFTLDGGSGHADGNGVSDSFAGTTFTWHAATVGAAPSSTPSPGGAGNYRGSGY